MSDKPLVKPIWWKNTYFLIAAFLVVIGIIGIALGNATIRDPGQRPESNLYLIYFGAAVIMFVNGWLSHRLTVQHYKEQGGDLDAPASAPLVENEI